jgi:uncharacterized membrane protein
MGANIREVQIMTGKKTPKPREIALTAVMTAVTAVVTMITGSFIPFPATGGYLNLGDSMVMLSGLLFGASLGGFAGGVGSALSDILLGYGYFAPLTLLIKGTEGFLAGFIGNSTRFPRKLAGVVSGAITMLAGYFIVETPLKGMGAALGELVAINSIQATVGAIVALVLAQAVLRAYPGVEFFKPKQHNLRTGIAIVGVTAIILAAIVGAYLVTGISP